MKHNTCVYCSQLHICITFIYSTTSHLKIYDSKQIPKNIPQHKRLHSKIFRQLKHCKRYPKKNSCDETLNSKQFTVDCIHSLQQKVQSEPKVIIIYVLGHGTVLRIRIQNCYTYSCHRNITHKQQDTIHYM